MHTCANVALLVAALTGPIACGARIVENPAGDTGPLVHEAALDAVSAPLDALVVRPDASVAPFDAVAPFEAAVPVADVAVVETPDAACPCTAPRDGGACPIAWEGRSCDYWSTAHLSSSTFCTSGTWNGDGTDSRWTSWDASEECGEGLRQPCDDGRIGCVVNGSAWCTCGEEGALHCVNACVP